MENVEVVIPVQKPKVLTEEQLGKVKIREIIRNQTKASLHNCLVKANNETQNIVNSRSSDNLFELK